MQIVILSNSHQQCLRIRFGILGCMLVALFGTGLGAAAYYAGTESGAQRTRTQLQAQVSAERPIWQQQIDDQRLALNQIDESLKLNINAIASRMGDMQANVARLNALGERLASMANLTSGEFDFTVSPAAGGRRWTRPGRAIASSR